MQISPPATSSKQTSVMCFDVIFLFIFSPSSLSLVLPPSTVQPLSSPHRRSLPFHSKQLHFPSDNLINFLFFKHSTLALAALVWPQTNLTSSFLPLHLHLRTPFPGSLRFSHLAFPFLTHSTRPSRPIHTRRRPFPFPFQVVQVERHLFLLISNTPNQSIQALILDLDHFIAQD
jgi:hypothetical protein